MKLWQILLMASKAIKVLINTCAKWADNFSWSNVECKSDALQLKDIAYEDDFDRASVGDDWDVSGLDSASISSGKLVTEGKTYSWDDNTKAAIHELDEPLTGNFVVEASLEWVGRSKDIGKAYLYLKSGSEYIYAGMNDAWDDASGNPEFSAKISNDNNYTSGKNTRPASGSMVIKITRINGEIKVYEDGNLRLTSTKSFNGDITYIHLANNIYKNYAGKTAKWDYVKAIPLKGERISTPILIPFTPKKSNIKWDETKPDDTDIEIYTGISDSKDTEPKMNCLSLDGTDDYVSFGVNNLNQQFSGASGLSFSGWIKPVSLVDSGAGYYNSILSVDIKNVSGFFIVLRQGGDIWFGGRSQSSDTFQSEEVSKAAVIGVWQHIVGILDFTNKKIIIYKNNIKIAEGSSKSFGSNTYVPDVSSSTELLGKYSTNHYFNGLITDVRIYTKVLSGSEIQKLYDKPYRDDVTSNLLGWWKLDDASGSTASDSSGNDNDGTISGATWYSETHYQNKATNDDTIPDLAKGKYLWCKQVLTTDDPAETPKLENLRIEVKHKVF